ncbi:MAG TPA: hypothetical protein VJR95_05435 [Rhodanobacter sp.]|nr:hypothetical protein [Rhodanobacter sp.]
MERTRWLVRSSQWEVIRKQGWFRYVVLRKAIPLGLGGLLGEAMASHLFHHDLHEVLVSAIGMFTIMAVLAAAHWMLNERRYHRSPSSPQDSSP